jgi:thioredoxin-related protein
MTRKILLTSGITIALSFALFLVYGIVEKVASKKEAQTKIQNIPVHAPLRDLDSTRFNLPINKNLVLIYFNSGCEHCQYELSQLKENITEFEGIEIVLMSSENLATIKSTSIKYELDQFRDVKFVKIEPQNVFENFSSLSVPNIFIYGADGRLIKEFKGETKMEAILQYARQ